MKWKLLSLSLLLVLTMTTILLVYTNQGFEVRELVLYAIKWGSTPEEYIDISNNPFKEAITSFVRTSSIVGAMEIPEDSTIRNWAESMLAGSSRERMNIKIGENEYYGVTIEYTYYHYSYSKYIVLVSLLWTICAWVISIVFLISEKSTAK